MSGDSRSSVWSTIGVGAAVAGLTIAQPLVTVAAPAVLAALVIEGGSTNQPRDGVQDFFHSVFNTDGTAIYRVNFLTGPFGIWRALAQASAAPSGDQNTVTTSDVEAADPALLSYMSAADPDNPALPTATWVLDNNVITPAAGFGSLAPLLALIGIDPISTPTEPGTVVISTSYEYGFDGNAPQYVTNPFAMANSIAAYLDRQLTHNELPMPVDADGTITDPDGNPITCEQTCYGTYKDANGNDVNVSITQVDGVTYVRYETDDLPLLSPLRTLGGRPGNRMADVMEPAMEALVDYGYTDNDPLANPGGPAGVRVIPTSTETKTFVHEFADGIRAGIATLDEGTPERTAPQQETRERPLLNVMRETQKFVPGLSKPTKPAPRPKLVPASVKDALGKLSQAFAPKKSATHDAGPGPSDPEPSAAQD